MRTKLFVLIMLASIVLSACGGGQTQALEIAACRFHYYSPVTTS